LADQNKTHPATPRRKEKARKQGQVPRSKELSSALVLASAVLIIWFGSRNQGSQFAELLRKMLAIAYTGDLGNGITLMTLTAYAVLRWTLPVIALGWVISVLSTIAQGGLVFAPAALSPDFSRFNPANNVKKLFTAQALSGVLKSLIPLGFLLYLFSTMLTRDWSHLGQSEQFAPIITIGWLQEHAYEIFWKSSLVFLGWSGFDFMLQRLNFNRTLRMSNEELREEHKELEGNPSIKGRIRRLQRQMRRKRMLHDVAKATVVVTNPDHFAVALEYHPGITPAPVVLAKGRNLFAQQIKQEARWHGIPIVENPPLAQALYRAVEVGQAIPAKLYAAVAEILAFIYRAQARARNASIPRVNPGLTGGAAAPPPPAN